MAQILVRATVTTDGYCAGWVGYVDDTDPDVQDLLAGGYLTTSVVVLPPPVELCCLPPGGTTNQILAKVSDLDRDANWQNAPPSLPSGPASGVLSGTYPNPIFAEDMATQAELDAAIAAGGPPTGTAGGVLSGTYPNPGLAASPALTGNPTAPTPAIGDSDTSIATTAFVRAELPWFNVKDYGATGNGTTDDTVAIKAAMAAAKATGSVGQGCVYFPNGTYIISSPLDYLGRYTILGLDCRQTTIKARAVASGGFTGSQMIRNWQDSDWTGGETDHRLAPNAVATSMLYPRISGLMFDPNDTPNLSLIAIRTPNETGYLRDLELHAGSANAPSGNTGTRGLDFQKGQQHGPLVENIVFYNDRWDTPVQMLGGSGSSLVGHGWTFRQLDIAGTFFRAQFYIQNTHDVTISATHIEGDAQAGALATILADKVKNLSIINSNFKLNQTSPSLRGADTINANLTGGATISNGGVTLRDVQLFGSGSSQIYASGSVFLRDPFRTLDIQSSTVGNVAGTLANWVEGIRECTEQQLEVKWLNGLISREENKQSQVFPGWVDAKDYGMRADTVRGTNGVITSGSNSLTGTFAASNAAVGKLVTVLGAGTVVLTNTDGAMSQTVSRDRNILTGSGFTSALIGRRITITGVGAAGATLTTRVWGIISSTQLRVYANSTTTASSQTYTISDDLYGVISASTATTATISTDSTGATPVNAGTSIASAADYWWGTDDAAAIQAAIDACLAGPGIGTVYIGARRSATMRSIGIGTTLRLPGNISLLGVSSQGFSKTLSQGGTLIKTMKPKMVGIRYAGTTRARVGTRGVMTSGSPILTDPDGGFTGLNTSDTVYVTGAGAQTGSAKYIGLHTTILSIDSDTQLTLNANASTSITDAVYSIAGSGMINFNGAAVIEKIHLVGSAGCPCGIHWMDANEFITERVTVSDFYSGIGIYVDGIPGNTQYGTIQNCSVNDSHWGIKAHAGGPILSGTTVLDGNSNSVAVTPGPGSIGIDDVAFCGGQIMVQAWDTLIYHDGHQTGAAIRAPMVRCECSPNGIVQNASTSGLSGIGGEVHCTSWANSSIGLTANKGLQLGANVKEFIFAPGSYIITDVDMYGGCDATALGQAILLDPKREKMGAVAPGATPSGLNGDLWTISVASASAFSIPNPTNLQIGHEYVFDIKNTTAGAMGAITWGAAFLLAGAFTNPAAGKQRTIRFFWDGTNMIELARAAADI